MLNMTEERDVQMLHLNPTRRGRHRRRCTVDISPTNRVCAFCTIVSMNMPMIIFHFHFD